MNVLGISRSIMGQPWRWRATSADARDPGFTPDDLVTQILLARGCPREALDLHKAPSIRGFMPDPSIFRDMDRAADRLADAVIAGEQVAIFGDYDVDGATSAALMVLLLRDLGIEARPYIPDRLVEGYGPSAPALLRLAAEGATLIVTVDCGAQAFDALAAAHAAPVDVVVVDHHKCASALPLSHALVNPNRLDEGDGAAHGHLAAVGVAFLLGAALVRTLRSARFLRRARRAPADRPARHRRARHRRRRRATARAQPRVRGAGAEGDGAAPQHRHRRADRGVAADPQPDRDRPRLRARPADQCRGAGRQVGSRRAPADDARPGRSARDRRRTRPA